VVALGLGQIVCWGVVYCVLAVVQVPMRAELGLDDGADERRLLARAADLGALRRRDRPLAGRPRAGARARRRPGGGGRARRGVSRVESLGAFFAVWVGMGVAMAATLNEPVFVVVAKRWRERPRSTR
jgi:hypothetical protein